MKQNVNTKGITLIELIISIGLVAVVMAAIYSISMAGITTYKSNMSSSVNQSNLRSAMMQIAKLQHNATSISWSSNTLTITTSASHAINVVKSVTQPDGTKVDELRDNNVCIAKNISSISMAPTSVPALGTDRMLKVTLTSGDISYSAQFYID